MRNKQSGAPGGERGQGGFSLSELLVVVAILALAVTVAVPLVADTFRMARIRSAADQFASDLRAARTVAVVKRATVPFAVSAAPQNTYQYTDAKGVLRRVALPTGVSIASASPTTINFLADGSVTGGATAVLEVSLGNGITERWTVQMNATGVPRLTKVRV